MPRESIRRRTRLAAFALTFSLVVFPVDALADGWEEDDDAAESTAGDMENHEAESKDPDGMTTESLDLDDMVVDSESLDDHMGESDDPGNMVVDAEEMSVTEAENLTDLKMAKPDEGFIALKVPGQSQWQPTTNVHVLMARKNLVRAEEQARAARTAYGEMMQNDYPRGEPRIRIVNERDASLKAFEDARQALADAEAAAPH